LRRLNIYIGRGRLHCIDVNWWAAIYQLKQTDQNPLAQAQQLVKEDGKEKFLGQ